MSYARLLIIGSNPSESSPSMEPFDSSTQTYRNLIDLLDAAVDEGWHIEFFNVLDKKTPDNRPLKKAEIAEGLPTLKKNIEKYPGYKIIAVGKTAQKAMTLLGIEHLELPHTSGLNRQWNDKDFKEQKIKELRDLALSSINGSDT